MKNYQGQICLIRTYSAGVHVGEVVEEKGQEVVLKNSIRIWKWDGAASLSQLAMEGVTRPENCKFAMPVNEIKLFQVIEIIPCTQEAWENINGVLSWKI